MAHPVPRVNADLQMRLGDESLERIRHCLYPVDCQMCGQPLNEKTRLASSTVWTPLTTSFPGHCYLIHARSA